VWAVQLYWGTKSELGEVVTRLSRVYDSAKQEATTRLQQVGVETVVVGRGDVNNGTGQLCNFDFSLVLTSGQSNLAKAA